MKTIHTKHAPAAIGPYSQAKSSPPTSPDKQSRFAKT